VPYQLSFASYQPETQPTFLRGSWGEHWGRGLGYVKDLFVEWCLWGVRARFVLDAPADALKFIGEERGIPHYPTDHPEDTQELFYRQRLLSAWRLWRFSGTTRGIREALRYLGFPNSDVQEQTTFHFPPSPGHSGDEEWWRFVVVLMPPHGFTLSSWRIGTRATHPPIGAGPPYIGDGRRPAAHQYIIPTIKAWKGAHTQLLYLLVIIQGAVIGGWWQELDGTYHESWEIGLGPPFIGVAETIVLGK
jgi:hypothetical protein